MPASRMSICGRKGGMPANTPAPFRLLPIRRARGGVLLRWQITAAGVASITGRATTAAVLCRHYRPFVCGAVCSNIRQKRMPGPRMACKNPQALAGGRPMMEDGRARSGKALTDIAPIRRRGSTTTALARPSTYGGSVRAAHIKSDFRTGAKKKETNRCSVRPRRTLRQRIFATI